MMAPMSASHSLDFLDRAIVGLDRALRTVAGVHTARTALHLPRRCRRRIWMPGSASTRRR
jgi:hypothetical protein